MSLRDIDFPALARLQNKHGVVYKRGQVIFRQGGMEPTFYVVLVGSVELSITEGGYKQVLHVAPPGDFFGEMSCFAGAPRSATATACDDSTMLLQFDQNTVVQLMRTNPKFCLGLIQRLCDRVTMANAKIAELTA
jgi:CRP/FNR family cyclic AMP-dependent transcriptional regulator